MDFFFKKLCEVFVKNVFIYTALFFGEKYFIEVLTKKIIDRYIFCETLGKSPKEDLISVKNLKKWFEFIGAKF